MKKATLLLMLAAFSAGNVQSLEAKEVPCSKIEATLKDGYFVKGENFKIESAYYVLVELPDKSEGFLHKKNDFASAYNNAYGIEFGTKINFWKCDGKYYPLLPNK